MVSVASPLNAYLFPEYILPRLGIFSPPASHKVNSLVRATYASCFASLANSASRFLDIVQILKGESAITSNVSEADGEALVHAYQGLHDVARADLLNYFEIQTKALLTDSSADVRRAFLGSVSLLCAFFGSAKANDVILSHLNTYLNDKDWRLKCSFFETIVGVAVYVGGTNLEDFILPLMVQALSDPEESVVEKIIRSFATMAQLGLFQRSRTWELVDVVARFSMHPNPWIREAAVHFVTSSTRYLSAADCECMIKPMLQPFLRISPKSYSEMDLLDALQKPLARPVLDMASMWAIKADKGLFWNAVQSRTSAPSETERRAGRRSLDLGNNALSKVQKNEEDQEWLSRLRNAGLTAEDEIKLIALREYIWRTAKRKSAQSSDTITERFADIVKISSLGIAPETVFFDHQEQFISNALAQNESLKLTEPQPQTIADALLDASTSLEERFSTRPGSVTGARSLAIPDRSKPQSPGTHSPQVTSPLSSSLQSQSTLVETDLKGAMGPPTRLAGSSRKPSSPAVEGLRHEHSLQRKGSAIDLLQQKFSTNKATPEIGTSSANAVGKNDGQYGARLSPSPTSYNLLRERQSSNPTKRQFQAAHNYTGNDPNVLKLLDTVYLDNFPIDGLEFGPRVVPVQLKKWEKQQELTSGKQWKPNGVMIGVFGEHTGPISRIVVSPDHLFFLTASGDGTVRVWDCGRFEQNLASKSRQVYRHGENVAISSVCFIKDTHCFASCASDGSVHVVKVDCTETSQSTAKYGKLRVLRQWQLPDPKANVVWCEHFRAESQSILILATSTAQVIALDLRSMSIVYTLNNPVQHGVPTCFCLAANGHWLLIGTSTGCLDLWDLRFQLRLKSWSMAGTSPIHRLYLHPSPPEKHADTEREPGPKRYQMLVCAVGGTGQGEVTIWDLESATCTAVYRVSAAASSSTSSSYSDQSRPYVLTNLETSSSSQMLTHANLSAKQNAPDQDMRSLFVGALTPATSADGIPRDPFFITAGPDTNVRFWNVNRIERSCIVSGPNGPSSATEGDFKFRRAQGSLIPTFEEYDDAAERAEKAARAAKRDRERAERLERERAEREAQEGKGKANVGAKRSASSSVNSVSGSATAAAAAAAGATSEPSEAQPPVKRERTRATVISEQQRMLLRSHLDTVLDVAVIEYPTRMVVSVDRSGAMFVFS